MRIALTQQNYMIGDFEGNLQKILTAIEKAKHQKTDLIVFSELSVCGYPPRDFLEFNDFISACEKSIESICTVAHGIAIIVGAPSVNPQVKGKDLFNSAYFIADGKVKQVIHKTLLPTYDVFDEVRYFEANTKFELIDFKEKKIALTICEDLWNTGNNPLYTVTPAEELANLNPDFYINISASPFDYNHDAQRKTVLKEVATKYHKPIFYCNCVGAQTELLFDGGSMCVNASGDVLHLLNFFEEDFIVIDTDENDSTSSIQTSTNKIQLMHDALVMGVKDYFRKLNFTDAVIGLSGGVDSALVTVLATEALGADHVHPVLMPSQYSSDHSVNDSVALCKNLGLNYEIIPIEKSFHAIHESLIPAFNNKPFDLTEENMQARIRGLFLMALTNKHHYILLNTSNKSEAAVGYGTLYGDMCGGLAVIADLYKTEVYELCAYINRSRKIIPQNILTICDENKIISYTINEIDMEMNKIKVMKDPNMRLNCSHKSPYTSHIFHTHPNKIYPSDIDIYKILKNDLIKHSYIISSSGYFKLSFPSNINIDEIRKIDKDKLIKILDKYYIDTIPHRGRIYIKIFMDELLSSIKHHINNILSDKSRNIFKIKFIPFKSS